MLRNTFEHGYADAVHGNQRVLGSEAYIEGYSTGVRHRRAQKALEFTVLAIITVTMAIVFMVWVTAKVGVV